MITGLESALVGIHSCYIQEICVCDSLKFSIFVDHFYVKICFLQLAAVLHLVKVNAVTFIRLFD